MNFKSTVNSLIKTVLSFSKHNAPTLLTAGGIGMGVATVAIVYKKSPTAQSEKKAAEAKAAEEGKNKLQQKAAGLAATSKVLWPAYVTGATSIGCLVASNKISNDRLAATVAACSYLENKIETMRETEKEVLGETKAADLERKTYEKMMEKSDSDPNNPEQPKKPYAGLPQLYYDELNGRFLESSDEELRKAENKINMMIYREYQDGSLDDCTGPNDFYELIGWPTSEGAKGWVWSSKDCFKYGNEGIDMTIGKTCTIAPNGQAAKVITFNNLVNVWSSEYKDRYRDGYS